MTRCCEWQGPNLFQKQVHEMSSRIWHEGNFDTQEVSQVPIVVCLPARKEMPGNLFDTRGNCCNLLGK